MVWTLPNLLSLLRILIIPVLVYLLNYTDRASSLIAALLFLLASITDYFDGYLARRTKTVSDLGKILDPLADKLIVASSLGKYKFILQSFAVVALLIHYRYWDFDFYAAGIYFLVLSAVIALWSGVNYHLQFFRLWQARISRV